MIQTPFQQKLAQQNALLQSQQDQTSADDSGSQNMLTLANQDPSQQSASDPASALPSGLSPNQLQAYQQSGQGMSKPAGMSNSQWAGLCQAYVEQQTLGHTGVYPSAVAAWNSQQRNQRTDLQNIKPGDALYFAPDSSNQGFGHAGIFAGYDNNGHPIMQSALYNGVQNTDLTNWNQKVLGYIPTNHK